MREPVEINSLLDRADAALTSARGLLDQLSDNIALGYAEHRRAEQARTFYSCLPAALAISLIETARETASQSTAE